jgi:hypothetical protein
VEVAMWMTLETTVRAACSLELRMRRAMLEA